MAVVVVVVSLPNEILINIIEKFVLLNNGDIKETIKLSLVSKLFKHYCFHFKYGVAAKIIKKYIKRNQYNVFYKKDPRECFLLLLKNEKNDIFKIDMNKIIVTKTLCVRQALLPSCIQEYVVECVKINNLFKTLCRTNSSYFNILQSIIVIGENINKVILEINNFSKSYYYNNNSMVTIYLDNGVYGPATTYINPYIYVHARKCTKIYMYGKFINIYNSEIRQMFDIIVKNKEKMSEIEQKFYYYLE